ncbi:MAG: hypothetical protein U0174_13940 [Polyangiaceae bacterium]
MIPTRFVGPSSLSPKAALRVWTAIFVASLGPPLAFLMPLASEFKGNDATQGVLAILSVLVVQLLVTVAFSCKTPAGAAGSAFIAIPLSIIVCALGGGFAAGPAGLFFGAAYGTLLATPVGLFFAVFLAPLFHLGKRAQQSHAIGLRDRLHARAAGYAGVGCVFAIMLGEPLWFAVPAILSFGFAAERAWLASSRARWLERVRRGEVPGVSIAEMPLTFGSTDPLPSLSDVRGIEVLVVAEDADSPYRSSGTVRPLLRLPSAG